MEIRDIELDRDEVFDARVDAINAFASLVESLDKAEAGTSTLDGTWTTTDVAAHVLTLFDAGRGGLALELAPEKRRTPRAVDEVNQMAIDRLDDRNPASLARRIRTDAMRRLEVLRDLPPDTPLPFWAGVTTNPISIACVALGEFLIHGHDIAAAVGRPWHIDPRSAAIVSLGIAPLIHGWVVEGSADGMMTVTLNDGPTLVYDFRADGLHVGTGEQGDDVPGTRLDPVDFMLAFPYRRVSSTDAVVNAMLDRIELI